ncbi:MAG: polysaccharide deacetylase family protein, partial [Syntrophothermus sp.]
MKLKLLVILILFTIKLIPQDSQNNIAITIDDLPVVTSINNEMNYNYIINNIIDKCKKYSVPAIGFVIENGFIRNGEYNSTLKNLMEKWIDKGLTLGNHTYSHK